MLKRRRISSLALLAFAIIQSQTSAADPTQQVNFGRDIQPLLQRHCVKCHGEQKAESELRLDSHEQLKSFGIELLLTPGKPDESELYSRLILGEDDDARMPKGTAPLDTQSIELIKRWIEQGADFSAVASATATPAAQSKPQLLEVTPAPPAAIEQLKSVHARVTPIFAGSNLLDVSFRYADHPVNNRDLSLLVGIAKQVTWLDLSNQKLTATDVSVLSQLPNLTRLNLSNSNVDDSMLSSLAGLQHLDSINLYATSISDAGLEHLKDLKSLKRIYTAKTAVTYAAAIAMEEKNPGLEINIGWDNAQATAARLNKELERIRKSKDEAAFQEAQFRQQKESAEAREKELVDELAKRSATTGQETSATSEP